MRLFQPTIRHGSALPHVRRKFCEGCLLLVVSRSVFLGETSRAQGRRKHPPCDTVTKRGVFISSSTVLRHAKATQAGLIGLNDETLAGRTTAVYKHSPHLERSSGRAWSSRPKSIEGKRAPEGRKTVWDRRGGVRSGRSPPRRFRREECEHGPDWKEHQRLAKCEEKTKHPVR
jgi:hypothetical protein